MNNQPPGVFRQTKFRQVDVGQAVVLNDDYLAQNDTKTRLKSVLNETLANAEKIAQDRIIHAEQEAEAILEAARQQAARILDEEGHQQRDVICQQAHEEGYQAGLAEGHQYVAQEVVEQVRAANQVLERAFEAEQMIILQHKTRLTELLHYVLTLVLSHELVTRPDQMAALIEKAARQIPTTGTVKILIHPEMLQRLHACSPDLVRILAEEKHLVFHPSTGCSLHDVYLETIDSSYDISPASQADVYLKAAEANLHLAVPQAATAPASSEALDDICLEALEEDEALRSIPVLSLDLQADPEELG